MSVSVLLLTSFLKYPSHPDERLTQIFPLSDFVYCRMSLLFTAATQTWMSALSRKAVAAAAPKSPAFLVTKLNPRQISPPSFRLLSDDSSANPGAAESHLIATIRASFPNASDIAVVDISGGCGSMYEVYVEAPEFKGVRMVKQHQMVTNALKKEIKDMHGLRISTGVSPCSK